MVLYLYGIGRPSLRLPTVSSLVEPALGDLLVVTDGDLGALAGVLEGDEVALTVANLSAHQDVVEAAARRSAILPARFGTVVASEAFLVEEVLRPRRAQLGHALDAVDGRVELRLSTSFDGDAALREAVEADAAIRRMRDRVQRRPAAAGYYDRIALGEAVMERLAATRAAVTADLAARLAPIVVAAKLLEEGPVEERTAYLVDRERLEAFDAAIETFADEHEGRVTFEVVGPLAPWDFTEPIGVAGDGGTRRMDEALASSRRRWES